VYQITSFIKICQIWKNFFVSIQQSSTIKKRPPAKLSAKETGTGKMRPDNLPNYNPANYNPVIVATESDLINQAISGSPRTSRKLNNKFQEVAFNQFCKFLIY
jgi:hypothetical protein